jgi:predicted dithiol-disulfide oxidoreductase (DUF899 family)
MQSSPISEQLEAYYHQMNEIRARVKALRAAAGPQAVENHTFEGASGPVTLAQLFGEQEYLYAVHNMGARCSYCTMWADGLNGVLPHLKRRAAFVLTSPDDPASQAAIREERGWKFEMVSVRGSTFPAEMGYLQADGAWLPGVSVFRKQGDGIVRVSDSPFGPGDDFCIVWHLYDLIPADRAGD